MNRASHISVALFLFSSLACLAAKKAVVPDPCARSFLEVPLPEASLDHYRRFLTLCEAQHWLDGELLSALEQDPYLERATHHGTIRVVQIAQALAQLKPSGHLADSDIEQLKTLVREKREQWEQDPKNAPKPSPSTAPAPPHSDASPNETAPGDESANRSARLLPPVLTFLSSEEEARVEKLEIVPGFPLRVLSAGDVDLCLFDLDSGKRLSLAHSKWVDQHCGEFTPDIRAIAPDGSFVIAGLDITHSNVHSIPDLNRYRRLIYSRKHPYLAKVLIRKNKGILGFTTRGSVVEWNYTASTNRLIRVGDRKLDTQSVKDAFLIGNELVLMETSGIVRLYDLPSTLSGSRQKVLKTRRRLTPHRLQGKKWLRLQLSPDEKQFIVSGRVGNQPVLWMWNRETELPGPSFEVGTSALGPVIFAPKRRRLIGHTSINNDGGLSAWDMDTGKFIRRYVAPRIKNNRRRFYVPADQLFDPIKTFVLSPDEAYLVGGTLDGVLVVWKTDDLTLTAAYDTDASEFQEVRFTPNGAAVLGAGDNGFLQAFDFNRILAGESP